MKVVKGYPQTPTTGSAPSSATAPLLIAADRRSLREGRAALVLQNESATNSFRYGGANITGSLGVLLGPGQQVAITNMDGPLYIISATTATPAYGLTEWLGTQ